MNLYVKSCSTCRYKHRDLGKEPCLTCSIFRHDRYRPSLIAKIKQFWDKFKDDKSLIGFKFCIGLVVIIAGLWIDGR